MRASNFRDRTGERHSRLTVIRKSTDHIRPYWVCACDCGNTTTVRGDHLKEGRVGSCGCIKDEQRTKHGQSRTRTYKCWQAMKDRCENPKNKAFENYGKRGISYCREWADFEVFYRDMGDMPIGLTLERVDNDAGYCASNCKWDTRAAQVRNRRNSVLIEIDGVTLCLKDWCAKYGVNYHTALKRIKRGLSTYAALGIS